ncbi:MAG TPA: hypothetical protein VIP10_10270 [Burkholderiaceae bacterium]
MAVRFLKGAVAALVAAVALQDKEASWKDYFFDEAYAGPGS